MAAVRNKPLSFAELTIGSARFLQVGDYIFRSLCLCAALAVPTLAALVLLFLVRESVPSIRQFGVQFFVTSDWDTNQLQFGAVTFIYGTLATSFLAMTLAVPVAVASAAFLSEIAPRWLRRSVTFLMELLAAIPSVVYGFWGIYFLVPILQDLFLWLKVENNTGRGILSAGVILAIMIVPYIAAITYDVCRAVPSAQRQGATALGATRWQTICTVVVPYAWPGIVGACFLALGRALGETMAVAMLIGNNTKLDVSLFGLGASIPSVIANELGTASRQLHKSALVELGLVLFVVTVLVNSAARILIWRVTRQRTSARPIRRWFQFWRKPIVTITNRVLPRLTVSAFHRQYVRFMDVAMSWLLGACSILTLLPLFHIIGYIAIRGFTSLNGAFFTNLPYDPIPGLGHALLGSSILVAMATVGAVPIGVLAALYLTEFRRTRLAPAVRFIGELLGGVPSIVVGIFAYALLVAPFGFSAWAGAFALLVLMIPVVMRASEESLKLVPGSLRNASLALGASQSQTVWRVIVPSALPAIITGIFLAIARIAGETAPLLFTAYNSNFWPRSLNDRTPFLTYYIYNYSLSDVAEEQRQAWAGALVLLLLIILLNVGIRLLTGRRVILASQAE